MTDFTKAATFADLAFGKAPSGVEIALATYPNNRGARVMRDLPAIQAGQESYIIQELSIPVDQPGIRNVTGMREKLSPDEVTALLETIFKAPTPTQSAI